MLHILLSELSKLVADRGLGKKRNIKSVTRIRYREKSGKEGKYKVASSFLAFLVGRVL